MFKAIIKFIRPRILITCYAVVFVGSASTGGSINLKTIFAIFVLIAWYIHAASTNDYADRHIDAVNLKSATDRPLQSKDVSVRQLWIIHFLSGVLALLFASMYGLLAAYIMAGMLLVDYLYSCKPVRISDRGILSPLIISSGYALYPFALGYWSIDSAMDFNWFLAIGLYLGFVGRVLLKDFRDVMGDKKYGKLTFVIRHGNLKTCLVSGIFWMISLISIYVGIRPDLFFTSALFVGFCFGAYVLYRLALSTSIQTQLEYVSHIARIANIAVLGVLAFLLCGYEPALSATERIVLPALIALLPLLPLVWRYFIEDTSNQRGAAYPDGNQRF